MITAVIFDMDGVIIDSEPAHLKLEQKLFAELDIILSTEEHHAFVGTTSYFMWQTIKEKHMLPQSLEDLVEMDRSTYFKFISEDISNILIVEGVKELIAEFHKRGIQLAVASSSPINVIEHVVKVLGIEKYFTKLVTGDYVKNSKPAPDIFLLAAEELGISAEHCLVIEDSSNGVKAAKAAGMKCIAIKNHNSGNQDVSSADVIIHSYNDINFKSILK